MADIDPLIRERALGAYLGLACGDALGATVEFLTPSEIVAQHRLHRHIKGGGWLRLRPGQVTDDTEMCLALGRALAATGPWDLTAIAESYAEWLKSKPVDVGDTVRRGIRAYIMKGQLETPPAEHNAGNGAAMRNLPTVLACLGDDRMMTQWSLAQAHLTHNNMEADAGLLALSRMTARLILGEGVAAAREEANRLIAEQPKFRFSPYNGLATGYIVDTVQTVLHFFFHTDSVESCVVATVNQGGDADTTGALAGMLAGALYGVQDIPKVWLNRLDSKVAAEIREQVAGLLRLAGAVEGKAAD